MTNIYIDNQKIDLYRDEQIKVKSSVLDIQDIEKNTTDYSNAFTVPASAKNNKIFKHFYNADIDNNFDARMSHPARIDMGGIPFKEGRIILQRVNTKSGAPSSYVLNFFGELSSLSEIFGDTYLSDMDFAAFPDVDYNSAFVKSKMTGGLLDLVAPLIMKRRCYYNSNASDTTETNIANNGGSTNGVKWDELRMAMRLETIIDEIETYFGLTFSDDLFHSDAFSKLYLFLDNDALDYSTASKVIDSGTDDPYIVDGIVYMTYGGSTTQYSASLSVVPETGYEDVVYTIYAYDSNNELLGQRTATGGGAASFGILEVINSSAENKTVHFQVVANGNLSFDSDIDVQRTVGGTPSLFNANVGVLNAFIQYSVRTAMPKITVSDFVKGLISAYYGVVIKQGDNIYVNDVESYYGDGKIVDLTAYTDHTAIPISRPDMLNDIKYSFQDGTTLLQERFNSLNGVYYGNEELKIYDDNGDLISGSSKDIELPFEQMVYERLIDADTGDATTLCVGASIDSDGEEVVMSPHIFYAVDRAITSNTILLVNDDGTNSSVSGNVIMPSHAESDSTNGIAFLFGSEYDEYNGDELTDNLYSSYHAQYITKLFSKKTRRYALECKNVPMSILTTIGLNDTIKVRNDYFKINSNTINLTTGSITLDLLR